MQLKTFLTFVGLLSPALAQRIVPGAYIVELKNSNSQAFLNQARQNGIQVTHRVTLDQNTGIFNGVSIHLSDDSDAVREKLNSFDSVVSLLPVRLYDAVAPASKIVARDVTRVINRANAVRAAPAADTFPPHIQGGVDKLRAEGLTGKGIKIGVVDTGIDYNHPSLGGGFGPGHKVAFGYDFVGDRYTGDNTPVPDPDPIDCAGHGTHVAGIIAAVDTFANFTGVAPDVTLGAYKVFGCPAKSVSNDVLIQAFLRAQSDGVDLITASIGGASGWTEDPWAVVVQRIVEAGTPCTIAAGNDGAEGLFYASGAADAIGAIAVGSVNNLNSPEVLKRATYSSPSAGTKNFGYTPAVGDFRNYKLPLYLLVVNGQIFDACTAFPASTPNLSGYLVVVRRGTCTFDTKVSNAVAKGAKNVMIVNNVPGTIEASVTVPNVNVGMVEPETGAAWLSLVQKGETVTVQFDPNGGVYITAVPNPQNGGSISTFTSWGPTYEMYQRPHVSAPGGNILSTYPLQFGGYAVLSGTSMATPYIAGCVALYLQSHRPSGKNVDPASIRSLLATTARPLVWNDGNANSSFFAPVPQQGGGLIDAYKFVHSTTLVTTDLLEFNDTQNFHASLDFKVTNNGNSAMTYSLTSVGGATAYTTYEGSTVPQPFPPDLLQSYATVSIDPSTLDVKPGQSKRVVVRVVPPAGLDASRIPVYGGWVKIKSGNSELLSIPYMGVATAMKHVTVTDFEEGFPVLITNSNQTISANGTKFTPAAPLGIAWSLVQGSAVVRIDVQSVSDNSQNTVPVFADKTVGAVPGYPYYYNPRNAAGTNQTTIWNGRVTKSAGSAPVTVPPGSYRFLYRALKVSGRMQTGRDYETWESPTFTYGK